MFHPPLPQYPEGMGYPYLISPTDKILISLLFHCHFHIFHGGPFYLKCLSLSRTVIPIVLPNTYLYCHLHGTLEGGEIVLSCQLSSLSPCLTCPFTFSPSFTFSNFNFFKNQSILRYYSDSFLADEFTSKTLG